MTHPVQKCPAMTVQRSTHNLLMSAIARFGRDQVAEKLDVDKRTLRRWEGGGIAHAGLVDNALRGLLASQPVPQPAEDASFTFIDLFAGIGGMRAGFESAGGRCVFTSEWNNFALETYRANFDTEHGVAGDITKVSADDIPDHDVLVAGFPCQPFSIAGVSKKQSLGRKHGFACEAQGTLFFDVARILKEKDTPAFLLENVKNLRSHDRGRTFSVIKRTLEDELEYDIFPLVVDAKGFVPQHRERIFIVGFKRDSNAPFTWDALRKPAPDCKLLATILHPEDGTEELEEPYTVGDRAKVNDKYVLSEKLWTYLQNYAAKHKKAGNGFGFGLVGPQDTARTLSARYYKDGSEILIDRGAGHTPRRLTPRECARLMGYPDTFRIPVSDTQAYKQFGNSVAVPVIKEIARIMKPCIEAAINTDVYQQARMVV